MLINLFGTTAPLLLFCGLVISGWHMRLVALLLLFVNAMAYRTDTAVAQSAPASEKGKDTMSNQLIIRVGQRTFTATLLTNTTATAFKAHLPLTLSMQELNGNEKYGELSPALPTHAANPDTIQAGDLMLYGSTTLVLFYETFRTTYSYTKIGHVDNPSGLAAALGTGNVTVSFSSN